MEQKRCATCGFEKDLKTGFFKDAKSAGGYRADCKECRRKKDRRRTAPALHPGITPEPEVLPNGIPNVFRHLAGHPEFEALLAAQGKLKAPPAPTGILGPANVQDTQRGPKLWRVVFLSDIHIPDQEPRFWAAALQFIRTVQPDEIILLGDFLELESCSTHKGADLIKLADDFEAGNRALDELQDAAPRAKLTYLEGNHETRLNRFLSEKAPALVGTLGVAAGLNLEQRGAEWVPEAEQPIARGDLDILHGHQAEGGARRGLPKHHADKVLSIYGRPGRRVVYGHTHKSQSTTRPSVGGHQKAIGMGCGRTLNPRWLAGSQAGWNLELAFAYVRPGGKSDFYPIEVTDGQFIWDGVVYGAAKL